jgi:arylsulfatase A-like enzyme
MANVESRFCKMKMERRDLLKSIGVAAASSVFGTNKQTAHAESTTGPSAAPRPNILVFLSDDHGQWLQQAYGNSEVQTPNLNRIARHGVRMTNAFTPCPVCSPARASFFTGCMPSQHGIHDWIEYITQDYAYPWLKGQTLLSELLQDAGYHTGLVGKWHCGEERYPHPGFDFWFSYWLSQTPHDGEQHFTDNGKHVTVNGFQSSLLTEQALRFLQLHYTNQATANKPFFLFVGYTDTHIPHTQMPDDLLAKYQNATFRDIPREPFLKVHGEPTSPVSKDPHFERTRHEQYYAAASSIDREVGKVLDKLESLGQMANTLVVYTGDHGLNAGQHGMWEKGNGTTPQNFLEESIRVPCAVAWANGGIPSGLESDLLVNHCDLFATLLDAAKAIPGADAAKRINSPGRSYLPQLLGRTALDWRNFIIFEYGNARMIRGDGYKLILRYPYRGVNFAHELYDLKADPRETANLYDDPQYGQTIKQMSERLNEFFSRYTVPAHDGLDLEHQATATTSSPWMRALKMKKTD